MPKQTQITNYVVFDLEHEMFDMKTEPKPEKPGILSLRTAVRLYASCRNPKFALEKTLAGIRAEAVTALAVGNIKCCQALVQTGY